MRTGLPKVKLVSQIRRNIHTPKVAVIGSGPAGFYTAKHILKGHPTAHIDIYEKLPVPFGLVRFGVAPDHPEVKNCINKFTETGRNNRVSFLGNVDVGTDISVGELQNEYTAVILAYGADEDKTFGIPGESLPGVLGARTFVGWYNGLPRDSQLSPNLDTDTAIVLGQGNVAIDVARILLTPLDILCKTDIPEYALEALSRSRVQRVYMVGRRGPLQVAFTIAELREMLKLPECRPVFNKEDFNGIKERMKDINRPRKRLTELLLKSTTCPSEEDVERWSRAKKEWIPMFLRSPLEVLASSDKSCAAGVRFSVNKLDDSANYEKQKAVPTGEIEDIPCGLVLRSIGYRSVPIDGVPFNNKSATIDNEDGRVTGYPGLYCSGWVKRGPVGVLATTMSDSVMTGKAVVEDLLSGVLAPMESHTGKQSILEILKSRGVQVVNFNDWEKLDEVEIKKGKTLGKPREKITDINEMLGIVK